MTERLRRAADKTSVPDVNPMMVAPLDRRSHLPVRKLYGFPKLVQRKISDRAEPALPGQRGQRLPV